MRKSIKTKIEVRKNRLRRRSQKILCEIYKVALLMACVIIVSALLIFTYNFIVVSPYFQLQEAVALFANRGDQIMCLADQAGGVERLIGKVVDQLVEIAVAFVKGAFNPAFEAVADPHLTVPMGAVEGLPIGLSIIGQKWSDADVLAAGFAYEQVSRKRVTPTYRPQ